MAIGHWRAALALFVLVLLTHGFAGNITSFDSLWVAPSALSLLHDGDFNLDEFQPRLEEVNYFGVLCVAEDGSFTYLPDQPRAAQRACLGHYHYYYPLAVPVLSAPLIWGVEASLEIARSAVTVIDRSRSTPRAPRVAVAAILAAKIHELERLAASIFIALATVLVFFLCLEDLPWKWAAGLALAFAFATPAWSTGSRGLWQHTLSMPLLAASLWFLSASRRRPGLAVWAGLTLMTAFWVRPTNIIGLGVLSLFVAAFRRRQLAGYLATMIPPVLAFGGINHSIYGSLLSPYSSTRRVSLQIALSSQFREALAANLISPARGLFVFCPFFALAGIGWKGEGQSRDLRWLRIASLAICFFHWILLSSFGHWWGGHCFGPRFFSDLSPILIFLLIPAVERIRAGSRTLAVAAALLLGCATFIHYQGAMTRATLDWNQKPVDIDRSSWRVWDWSDPSFLRSFKPPAPGPKR